MEARVIFFDIGHTLVTGAELSPRRILGSRLNLSEKETKLIGHLIMTCDSTDPDGLLAAMSKTLPTRDPAEIGSVLRAVWEEQTQCVREIRGAMPLLRALKADGFKLGIISNIWHPFYMGFRETCAEAAALVDHQVLSYRMGCKKPSPSLFREAVKRTGEPPESCWMVGDSYELDVSPALQIGMRALWVLSRPEKEKHILARILRGETRAPSWATDNLEEIYPFFVDKRMEPWSA